MSAENNGLSTREIEILRLVATGVSNKEIAQKLTISPNTVKVHLRNVFTKIGAASRTEATLIAMRMGLVERDAVQLAQEPEQTPAIPAVLLPEVTKGIAVPKIGVRSAISARLALRLNWLWPAAAALVLVALLAAGGLVLTRSGPLAPSATPTPIQLIPSSTLEIKRWLEASALPGGRGGMASAVYEGAIYIFGGETSQGASAAALRYRPSPGGWETLADKPTPVSDIEAVVIGDQIYVPGGKTANGKPVNKLEVYSPRLNRWEALAPIPTALSRYSLVASEGRLYLFGGWDGSAYSAAVYSYDPASNTWLTRTPLPSPRGLMAAALVENKIYVIGGTDGKQSLRNVLVYFPQRDQAGDHPWDERAPLSEGRYGMGAASLANLIYLVGGINETRKPGELAPVQYQTLTDRWSSFDRPSVLVGSQPAVLALDTRLHILGGLGADGPDAHHLTYQAIYTIVLPTIQQ
jgi:DNA-binding CsgD family transcriptional regulator/N-acetylneuraminic acid mutarotase